MAKFTNANGFIDAYGDLTEEGKGLVLEQMHSKFLGHTIFLRFLLIQRVRQLNSRVPSTLGFLNLEPKKRLMD